MGIVIGHELTDEQLSLFPDDLIVTEFCVSHDWVYVDFSNTTSLIAAVPHILSKFEFFNKPISVIVGDNKLSFSDGITDYFNLSAYLRDNVISMFAYTNHIARLIGTAEVVLYSKPLNTISQVGAASFELLYSLFNESGFKVSRKHILP